MQMTSTISQLLFEGVAFAFNVFVGIRAYRIFEQAKVRCPNRTRTTWQEVAFFNGLIVFYFISLTATHALLNR